MALLKITQRTGFSIEDIAPAGQYLGVCLKIEDSFGVTRTKFNSSEEEVKDVTRFLFGLKDLQSGRCYLVQTFEFTITALPSSNLMKFLTQWLGTPPQIGWDYCELENSGGMFTIAPKESGNTPGKFYAKIVSQAPVMPQMAGQVPHPSEFAALVAAADTSGGAPPQAFPAVSPPPVAAPAPQIAQAPPVAAPIAQAAPAFPYGWTAHPQAPGQYYQGQEVLAEADLRARFEPAPIAAPIAAPAPPLGNFQAPSPAPGAGGPLLPTGTTAASALTAPSLSSPPALGAPPLAAGAPAANPFG
tara:strand:- start:34238 stop:35140 length:903 start_codon:yes stop_codon:yes gene_type:complete